MMLSGDYDLSGVKAVEWGITHEITARKAYSDYCGNSVQETGIWISLDGKLGASPDGLISSDTILEIKCPFKFRNMTLKDAASNSDFYLQETDGLFTLKTSHEYWHQVQGVMCLTGRQFVHFFVWLSNDFVNILIPKDPDWEIRYIPMLTRFYDENIFSKFISL
jgi:hypothetical protein